MTNTTGSVAPTRSSVGLIGTNPIAIAAPAGHRPPSASTWRRRPCPAARSRSRSAAGRRSRSAGRSTATATRRRTRRRRSKARSCRSAVREETAGYKGYGLALAVDVLTGVLAGATFGKRISGLFDTAEPSDLGQLFLVIDPGAIGDAAGVRRAARRLPGRADRGADGAGCARTGPRAGRARGGRRSVSRAEGVGSTRSTSRISRRSRRASGSRLHA